MVCKNVPVADPLPPRPSDIPSAPTPTHKHAHSAFTGLATSAAVVAAGLAVDVVPDHSQTDTVMMDCETSPPSSSTATSTTSTATSTTTTATTSTTTTTTVTTHSHSSHQLPSSASPQSSSSNQPLHHHPSKDVFDDPALSTSTVTTSSDPSTSSAHSSPLPSSSQDQNHHPSHHPSLTFRSGVVCIPHPEKAKKGGEDAYFIHKNALGVFDGVGGWASIGVDAGLYSKELARLTAGYVATEGPATVVDALRSATEHNRAIGSSTACVVGLDGSHLIGVNLGDSGLVVIRNGAIVYRTTEQQHYFNCPFQIGTDSLDTVDVGRPIDIELQHGDWIVMGTDGLWDNVFPNNIVNIVVSNCVSTDESPTSNSDKPVAMDSSSDGCSAASDCSANGGAEDAQVIAQQLAECAVKVANDERGTSPFAVNAQNAGHLFLGGKIDDITIISAYVVDPDVESYAGKSGWQDSRIGKTQEKE